MPIEGLSELVRIPRLGKIHLGIKTKKDKGPEYPKATDYFVVPDEVAAVYGKKPTELQIMFPVEDPEIFAQQWLRAYSLTQGLVCIGNGINARRKVDLATGAMADHQTKQWEWRAITCDPQECPDYKTKRCRRVMNLQFLLPEVPGLGVYQIDTSSFYSIVNINSMIQMLKGIIGRCSMVPLTLVLGPENVSPPGQTQKTVYIMHIKKDIKLAQLAQIAMLPPARVLIPEPDVEEIPDEFFPDAAGEAPKAVVPVTESEKSEGQDLFAEEEEIPQVEDELLKGWMIVKNTLKQVTVTDRQIRRWFAHYNIEIGLSAFDKVVPPQVITNEILSKFQTMLDAYREQKEKEAKTEE